MSAKVDLFWSFRSPYSYLAMPGALDVLERFDVEMRLRPVLPLALRSVDFFSPENQYKVKYLLVDYPRRAELLGMPGGWPSPDPIVQDLQTFKVAEEQPYIHPQLLFSGVPGWDQGDLLKDATSRAGLDLEAMDAAIADPSSHRQEVDANQVALDASGHKGVPTFVYNEEPFFGQDRIDSLCFQLEKDGLSRSG